MRILNAAYKEFAEQGYDKASTNQIVKEAGIGKGMLFYYFKSKEELYHYLIDQGTAYVINAYLNKIDETQQDYIEKYKQAGRVKMMAYAGSPHIFNFFGSIYLNSGMNMPEELLARLEEVKRLSLRKLYSNIDTSLFREDLPADKVLKLMMWTLDGYEKELVNSLKGKRLADIDFGPYWDQFYEYLDLIRKVYYK